MYRVTVSGYERNPCRNVKTMDEMKQIICKKCKCNKFTIIKTRTTTKGAIYGSKGYRTFLCLNCDSIETEWEIIEKVNTIRISEYTEKIEDLVNVSNYVRSVEKVQGIKIACLEEISLLKKWINKNTIKQNIKFYGNSEYSVYLKEL